MHKFFQFSIQTRLAVQTTLAIIIAVSLALLLKVSAPYWAAISAVFMASSHVGGVVDKAIMRMIGTISGGVLGILIVILFAQHTYGVIISLAVLILICCYCSAISRYQYALILLPVTTVMIALPAMFTPASVYKIAAARVIEISLGVIASWLVSWLVFPMYASDKLEQDFTDLLTELKQSFVALTKTYLAKADNDALLAKKYQQINQKLHAYKKLLNFARKERAGKAIDSWQTLNNIRNMRFLVAQQVQFSNLLKQNPEARVPALMQNLLQQAAETLTAMFDFAVKPMNINLLHHHVFKCNEILNQIYILQEENRKSGAAFQYSVQENTVFYTFLELLEQTQYRLTDIIKSELKQPEILKYSASMLHHVWQRVRRIVKQVRNNVTEVKHAIKVMLSAMVTILIWFYSEWYAAVIATVSVLAVAQLNMYSSKTKARSRIIGCLLGGAVGITLVLLPLNLAIFYMLVVAGFAIFSYLSAGKGNQVDIGIQANVALATTAITVWGAHAAVTPGVNRLAGVILGSVIAVLVSYFIWPLNPITNIRKRLAENYNDFASWLNALANHLPSNNINLLRQTVMNRFADTELLLNYLSNDPSDKKYEQALDLQYQLCFVLLSLTEHMNNLNAMATALAIDVQDYLQQASAKLNELAGDLSAKQVDIEAVLQAARQQLLAVREQAKITQFGVYEAKEFMVGLSDLVQLLTLVSRLSHLR